jgi:hypothetical protein
MNRRGFFRKSAAIATAAAAAPLVPREVFAPESFRELTSVGASSISGFYGVVTAQYPSSIFFCDAYGNRIESIDGSPRKAFTDGEA